MPSKIKLARKIISSSPSVAETLASVPSLDIELPNNIGRRMFGILDNIPQEVRGPGLNYSRGLLFQTNPDTGMPKLTQAGDMMLTDTGLDIAYAGDDLKGQIFDVINRGYPAKYLDPGMQTWIQQQKQNTVLPDPWDDPVQQSTEAVIRQSQQANAAIPRRTNPELGQEVSREEWLRIKKEKEAARRSAYASQMGVPSQPVPGTSSELSLEGSSGNQPGVNAVIPNYSFSDSVLTQADKLRRRLADPNTLRGGVRMSPQMNDILADVSPTAQVQQAVQEQAGKAAAGSNALDVKQEAAAIQKETSTGRAGDIPWWQNPYYYLAGAGGALGGAILGNALSGGSPSYEEQMMMSQYGQMPSSFDDRYGY